MKPIHFSVIKSFMGDRNQAHQLVASLCFFGEEYKRPYLFRFDLPLNQIFLQSISRPKFNDFPHVVFETKKVDVQLRKGCYSFKTHVSPTEEVTREPDSSGGRRKYKKRKAITSVLSQKEWLNRFFQNNGIELVEFFSKNIGMAEVVRKNETIPILDVEMTGVLKVIDPIKAEDLLERGIGSEKAFGFGLLFLRPQK